MLKIKTIATHKNGDIVVCHTQEEIDYYTALEDYAISEQEMMLDLQHGWKKVKTLNELKQEKIKELDANCTQAILGRFSATINNTEYEFSYDAEAQSRFNGIGLLFFANKIQDIEWTAYQNGERVRITLNQTNFDSISLQALQHQNTNIIKYNTLLQQVNEATTKEQVEAIVW